MTKLKSPGSKSAADSELIATISHELKTPLTAIQVHLDGKDICVARSNGEVVDGHLRLKSAHKLDRGPAARLSVERGKSAKLL